MRWRWSRTRLRQLLSDICTCEALEDVDPLGGRLVLFRSRDVPHEVLPTSRKRFAVSLWLPGPAGPGDDA